jgi:hypothetical protein
MDVQLLQFVAESSHLLFGAFATFCAILLWSRTRDMAWTLVIVGVIISYAGIVYSTLSTFGIIDEASFALRIGGADVPVVRLALADLPPLFLGIGFLVAVTRRKAP